MDKFSEIIALPKGDLHLHLNGAVPTQIVKNLLEKYPEHIPQEFLLEKDLNILSPQDNLMDYLRPWRVLNLVPRSKNELILICISTFQKLKLDNVKFVEIRNSVFYIAKLNSISDEEAIKWLIEALELASTLTDIAYGLIMTIKRSESAINDLNRLKSAIRNLNYPKQIIGIDLAGNEDLKVSNDLGHKFAELKYELNLSITIHAGETGNLDNVVQAINVFHADRIGHGTAAMYNLEVMNLLKEKNIAVEVCPISNRRTNSIKDDDYYTFHQFLKYEVPFILCSDNPAIHKSSLSRDYEVFLNETNHWGFLARHFNEQLKYTFIKDIKN